MASTKAKLKAATTEPAGKNGGGEVNYDPTKRSDEGLNFGSSVSNFNANPVDSEWGDASRPLQKQGGGETSLKPITNGKVDPASGFTPLGQNPGTNPGASGTGGVNGQTRNSAQTIPEVTGLDEATKARLRSNYEYTPVTAEASQEAKDRLRASLEYSANKQIEQSDKSYAAAKSAADRQALSRGMGRSSYTAQVLANMDAEKTRAANDIRAAMEAEYNKGLNELDRQALEDARYNQQMQYQVSRDMVADEAAIASMDEQIRQRQQSQANWANEFNANQEQQAWQRSNTESEQARDQANQDRAFQMQQEQFREQMDFNKMDAKQKLAVSQLETMAQGGANPSDEMLAAAGITRADYNAWVKAYKKIRQQNRNGGGSGSNPNRGPGPQNQNGTGADTHLPIFGDFWVDQTEQ